MLPHREPCCENGGRGGECDGCSRLYRYFSTKVSSRLSLVVPILKQGFLPISSNIGKHNAGMTHHAQVLMDYYPGRFGKLIVINPGLIFHLLYTATRVGVMPLVWSKVDRKSVV